MLSWFNRNVSGPPSVPKPKPTDIDHKTDSNPLVLPPETNHGPTPATAEAEAAASSEQPQKPVFTAALSTPHDAVLADLQGHHPDPDPPTHIDPTPSTSALGMPSLDTLPAATSEAPGSVVSSSSPPPESLYDPFTGGLIGVLTRTSSAKQSGEELWAHLARIRALQAEVAGLHVTMEGIGLGELAVPRLRSTTPRAVGERLMDNEDSDGDGGSEVEERQALEFERAERRFDGRREEIEQIMTKARSQMCTPIRACADGAGATAGRPLTSSRSLSRPRYSRGQLYCRFTLHDHVDCRPTSTPLHTETTRSA